MAADIPRQAPKNSLLIVVLAVFAIVAAGGAVVVYSLGDWNAPARVKNMPNPWAANAENVRAGERTYRARCAKCHGDTGGGKGEKAGELSVAPTDFTNRKEMERLSDGELFWRISVGHRPMPAYKGKLSERERWQLVVFIRTFASGSQR